MKINYNATAMVAKQALEKNNNAQSTSTLKLSSGLKIMSAKDNAAGYAISRKMTAQIRGLNTATDSSNDGISVAEIADGAMMEIHSILQRMNELAVKGANGTMTSADRTAIDSEIRQLANEINRIGADTEFNGQPLLDGNFDTKAYTDTYGVKVKEYSDEVPVGTYRIDITGIGTTGLTGTIANVDAAAGSDAFVANAYAKSEGNVLTILDHFGRSIDVEVDPERLKADNGGTLPSTLSIEVDVKGIGEMNVMVGANENQMLQMRLPRVSLDTLGLTDLDYTTQEGCKQAITRVNDAIATASSIRSRIGAYQNRLESTVNNLETGSDNMTGAYSRIMDVDMAKEMTEYYTSQVLVQEGTSVLAQANSQPEQVLQLLQ